MAQTRQFKPLQIKSGSFTGSFTGSFSGNGSGITGLNLSRIASGSVTASIAPDTGLQINTDTTITGGKLTVVGTGSAGVVSNFGIAPLTSSFTVWDSQYYASSSQLNFLGPYTTNTVLATLVNKKPFGSATDDDYTQFANYLELSYTASDADRITLNRGIIDINLSSSYTQSGDITANWTNVTQRGNGYNSAGFTNTYIVNTVSQSSYSDNTNGLWTVTSVNSSSVLNAYGVRSTMTSVRSSSIDTAYLFHGVTQAATWSRIRNAYGLYLDTNMVTNASMSNYTGVTVTGRATGSVSNALILLGTGSIPAGNWSIYNTSSYQNYLRGWVGINKPIPSTNLDIIGDVYVTGSIRATADIIGSFTGSLQGTSSFSVTSLNTSDILIYVKNTTGNAIEKGKVVRIYGATGDNALIATASYESDAVSANTLGILNETIADQAFGYAMTEGKLLGINTDEFTAGQLLYLGATGSIVSEEPRAPLHAVRLGQALRIHQNNGSMYVRIDNGYELDELHNVLIISASDGDLLVASGSNENGKKLYINSKQLTGSYALTGSLNILGSVTGSFTGSFFGDGSGLINIPSSGILGLNLSRIVSGSATASISPNNGFIVNINTTITSSAPDIFLIKNAAGYNMFTVSQSGVIVIATQSAQLIGPAIVGGIYFTSNSMYIGLET